MILVLGTDIGLEGAFAVFNPDVNELLVIEDMPVDRVVVGDATRGRVSDHRLLQILAPMRGMQAFIERPEARPMRSRDKATGRTVLRQPGAAGMLALGEGYGIVRCACAASGIAVEEVRPGAWKREMGVTGDKDMARRRAAETFPDWASWFSRKKDSGRAEAALIAVWGARRMGRTVADL